ncbi:MAG: FAD-dependent oxidoreductase [Bacteroidales bacterium]|nr:FAD-dependent oxidoreductase [Bacteroidales bacterium]
MKNKYSFLLLILILIPSIKIYSASVLVEAESFQKKGGWVVDQQFMDIMGSPYLMAHGMGRAVENAETFVDFPQKGKYFVFVRTYNWTSPWSDKKGPGSFAIEVDGKTINNDLGTQGNKWEWQYAGEVTISSEKAKVTLKDNTGFNGRCDAICFKTDMKALPNELEALESFRNKQLGKKKPKDMGSFDLVVVGAGVAGISAAISAARLGLKVALINDRYVLGGNNSSEIRVHLGGRIETEPYPNLGSLQKEFGPVKGGNAQPAEYYEDNKKMEAVLKEKNITLFPGYRAIAVDHKKSIINSVKCREIQTNEDILIKGNLFSDCTGDGTVGYLAGADYSMGREGKDIYNEPTAPEKSDKMTMGSSVQWYSEEKNRDTYFPHFNYGGGFNDISCEKVTMGEWTWETGMNLDQINDFEKIRDYGLLVVYSNWSHLKNNLKENELFKNRDLKWVAYIAGKRESRRLLGDYVLKEQDIREWKEFEDASAVTSWSIDLHYPDPANTKNFPSKEFKSIAKHINIHPYPIPYRCLYSRNIGNLFMAGRNISVSHVALGTVRVMRTTGIMGEVVGMAASICNKYNILPRDIYSNHLDELKQLMNKGVGDPNLKNNQRYNEGGTLGVKKK